MNRLSSRRCPLGACAALLLLAGSTACDRDAGPQTAPVPPVAAAEEPAPAPEPAPAAAPQSAPPVAIPAETPDGKRIESHYTGEQQPPAGLPEDLPVYAAATPISSMASPERGTIVNLRTADPADAVFAWYQAELPKRGWQIETQSGAGGQHLLTATKSGRKATALVTTGAAGTQILLTVLADH